MLVLLTYYFCALTSNLGMMEKMVPPLTKGYNIEERSKFIRPRARQAPGAGFLSYGVAGGVVVAI